MSIPEHLAGDSGDTPPSAPQHGPPPAADAAGSAAPDAAPPAEPGAGAERHRTHPVTPLVTGWKIVVGIIAVLTAQNIARLIEDFTVQRALIGLGMLVVAIVIAIILSSISWWFTTYAVDDQGVSLHSGMISRSREYAPRARIESVSVERPLLARLLGLAKVRIEVAGGGDSFLDIQYVKSAEAEELRRGILGVAAGSPSAEGTGSAAPRVEGEQAAQWGHEAADEDPEAARPAAAGSLADDAGTPTHGGQDAAGGVRDRVQELLYDGVTDGEPIASIPTRRLVHSLLRDIGFLLGAVMSLVGVVIAVALAIWQDGINLAMFLALAPAAVAVPKYIFGRIESGWGFVSRITDRGLRMRRGLANTRTDNIVSDRIQRFDLRRPLLWRTPDWTAVSVTVAGIEDDDESGASNVLPVGTREELEATLGHLAAPLGTADDLATIEHLLTAPARQIEGMRTRVRWYWISARTQVSVLLPGALVHRSGILTRRLEIVPRERIQDLSLEDDPFRRRLDLLDLRVGGAGDTLRLNDLPRQEALALHAVLRRDARTLRRYREREQWPEPALGLATAPAGGTAPADGTASTVAPAGGTEGEQ